jgi:predicted tellurium resistance membrane protein TerC
MDLSWINDPQAWIALATLTALEIVLGIDNVIFISILSGRLPESQRAKARKLGLLVAMVSRILLLTGLGLVMRLTAPWFRVFEMEISGRDLILIVGGLFLLAKSTLEIHHRLEGDPEEHAGSGSAKFGSVIVQIALLDIVFSLDSVITAIGMAQHIEVMVIAVLISVGVMVLFVNTISDFVERHPTFKMLALSFLLLIGVALVGDGLEMHIPKGYLYFAMGFSLLVEVLNMRVRAGRGAPVRLRGPELGPSGDS